MPGTGCSLATIVELSSSSMFVHSFLEHYNLLDTGSNLHDRPLARLLKSKAVSLAILTNIPVDVLYNFYFDNYAEESNYTCIITFGTTFLLIIRLSILPSPARIVCRTWNVHTPFAYASTKQEDNGREGGCGLQFFGYRKTWLETTNA